jgi:hypothetical protein
MSAPAKFASEKERAQAARLASEPSDEAREAPLRDEAHHHRDTVYVRSAEAREGARAAGASAERAQQQGSAAEQARGV